MRKLKFRELKWLISGHLTDQSPFFPSVCPLLRPCISVDFQLIKVSNTESFISCLPGICPELLIPNFNEKHVDACCFVQITQMLRGIFSFTGTSSKYPMSFSICDLKNVTLLLTPASHTTSLGDLSRRYTFSSFFSLVGERNHYSFSAIHFISSLEFPAPVPSFSNDSNEELQN